MRLPAATRPSPHCIGTGRARKGVVLLVVIGMLTLFALVGVGFVLYADASKPGANHFLGEAEALAEDTLTFAAILGHDLQRATHEPVDFRPHLAAIDDLADRARTFKTDVAEFRDLETAPDARRNLDALIDDIEIYSELIEDLRCLLKEILVRQ